MSPQLYILTYAITYIIFKYTHHQVSHQPSQIELQSFINYCSQTEIKLLHNRHLVILHSINITSTTAVRFYKIYYNTQINDPKKK